MYSAIVPLLSFPHMPKTLTRTVQYILRDHQAFNSTLTSLGMLQPSDILKNKMRRDLGFGLYMSHSGKLLVDA